MNYKWKLTDLKEVPKNGYKVFSTFSCGGGSSMGYKLAGYDVVGICDIDPQMINVYDVNLSPKVKFKMGVQEMKNSDAIPDYIFGIDILDGSPPCSTFSMSGQREKNRGKNKKFREGQRKQVLSDLFFDFLDLAERLRPKVIVAENVEGIIQGNAKGYTKKIAKRINDMGYTLQIFLLNSATMGVPQTRKRVFFIAHRKEYNLPKLVLDFNEKPIVFGEFDEGVIETYKPLMPSRAKYFDQCKPGDKLSSVHPTGGLFNSYKLSKTLVAPTITSSDGSTYIHPDQPRRLTTKELCCIGSRPQDYNFNGTSPQYIIGMSVPPLMMYGVAKQIKEQWLDLLPKQ